MNGQMTTNLASRFFLLLLAAALLAACSSCPEPEQQLPDGIYTTTLMVEDLSNIGMPPDGVCENAGTFNLTVTGKNWSMFQTPTPGCIVKNPSWSGTWKICGNEATFTDEYQSCYTYQWAFDGTELRFTRDKDNSPSRIVLMTTYPWVLQK